MTALPQVGDVLWMAEIAPDNTARLCSATVRGVRDGRFQAVPDGVLEAFWDLPGESPWSASRREALRRLSRELRYQARSLERQLAEVQLHAAAVREKVAALSEATPCPRGRRLATRPALALTPCIG